MSETPAARQPSAFERILQTAVDVRDESQKADIAYLARELVQCTLPHSDPGDVPGWSRTNGNLTLGIRPGLDHKTNQQMGYPFGSIPRLILFWLNTEAVRTGKARLELGDTLAAFMRDLGLNPNTGHGKRSDAVRLRAQMEKLFRADISFERALVGDNKRVGKSWLDMKIAPRGELWWSERAPDQAALWGSWVELSAEFFEAITTSPIPADKRIIRCLKRSPLALDLYVWATHKAFQARKGNKAIPITWESLAAQFGDDYGRLDNFKGKAISRLHAIMAVFPDLQLRDIAGGIEVLPTSRPSVPVVPGAGDGAPDGPPPQQGVWPWGDTPPENPHCPQDVEVINGETVGDQRGETVGKETGETVAGG